MKGCEEGSAIDKKKQKQQVVSISNRHHMLLNYSYRAGSFTRKKLYYSSLRFLPMR